MSAKKFIQLLRENGLLDDATLKDLQRQLGEKKKVKAATIAKALVQKGLLTKFQATKFVGQATADEPESDEDELGLADTGRGDETVILEDASADEPEEVVGLTPVEDAGAALTPVAARNQAGGPMDSLEPLDGGLEPMGGGGAAADPFADPFAQQQPVATATKPARGPKKLSGPKKQVWDTKLMLGGGGLLLFLFLAGGILYWSLSKADPQARFDAAEEAYRNESYMDAQAQFEKFVDMYPKDDNFDNAQVRIVFCKIRNLLNDPQKASDTANELLPPALEYEAFGDYRDELPGMLPEIPKGFVKRAKQAPEIDAKEEMILKAETAMTELVMESSYIPPSKRPPIENDIKRINEDILLVKREIAQNRELAKAIAGIEQHTAASETEQAYGVYLELLKVYPGLRYDPGLIETIKKVSDKEKGLVKTSAATVSVSADDHQALSDFRVALGTRTGDRITRLEEQVVSVLVGGSAYGLNAGSGEMLWRRYVGYETQIHPVRVSNQPDADVIVADSRRQEVVRVTGKTGQLVWRVEIGAPFYAPVVAGDKVYVTLSSGVLLQLDQATGQGSQQATIPQKLEVPPGVAQLHPYLFQLGERANLYTLSTETMTCEEVLYLGHKPGTITVPPLVVQDHVLIAENETPSRSRLHVYKVVPGGDGPLLRQTQDPIQLTGNVVVPMALYRYLPVVVTDLGEIRVFNVDFNGERNTLTDAVTPSPASRKTPILSFPVVEGTTLLTADDQLVKYQLQVNSKKIVQQSVTNTSETFISPPKLLGDILIATRRLPGSTGTTVSAIHIDSPRNALWTTHLGVPTVRAEVAGGQMQAVSASASLFDIGREVLQSGLTDQPAATALTSATTLSFTDQVEFANGKVAFFNPSDNKSVLVYTPGQGAGRLRIVSVKLSGGKVDCSPVAFGEGLLVPVDNGSVLLVDTVSGSDLVLPFQPKLGPGELVKWNRPAVVGDEFVIADNGMNIYRVGVKQEPKPFLAPLQTGKLDVDINSDLAAAGDTVYGVVRNSGGDVVLAINAGDLTVAKEFPLQGHVTWGPVQIGDAVLCLADADGLLCFEAGAKQRWALASGCGGNPAGRPLLVDNDYVFALLDGSVVRVSGATGEQLAKSEVGEPLGAGPVAYTTPSGTRLLLSGNDGVLHVIRMPGSEG